MGVLTDEGGGQAHQICSFVWADDYWMMSLSKDALGADDEGFDRERRDSEPKTSKSVVDKHRCFRRHEGHYDLHATKFWATHLIKQGSARKKECKMQTRLGGEMRRFGEANVPSRVQCRRMVEHFTQ